MSVQIVDTKLIKKNLENHQITMRQEDILNQRMFLEEEVIQAFQEAVSRIGGRHDELSDIAYFKLLLNAKYARRINQKPRI